MASAPSAPERTKESKADGKRKASCTPEAPDSERFEDPQTLQNASKLQCWFVLMMHDAAMIRLLVEMLEGSVKEKGLFENVQDLMEFMDKKGASDTALKLLQWIASCKDEPYTSFGLKGHEHLFNYDEDADLGNGSSGRFVKECSKRQKLLLNVANVCAARAPPRQATAVEPDQHSSATGKPAKANVERWDLYQTPKPKAGPAKSVKIREDMLQFIIETKERKFTLSNCFKRMQLLLLSRLIAASLSNKEFVLSSSVSRFVYAGDQKFLTPKDKEIGRLSLNVLYSRYKVGTELFVAGMKDVWKFLDAIVPDTDNAFEPFAGIGGKTAVLDEVRKMYSIKLLASKPYPVEMGKEKTFGDRLFESKSKSEWRPEKSIGDRLFESVLNMVCGLPVLELEHLSG